MTALHYYVDPHDNQAVPFIFCEDCATTAMDQGNPPMLHRLTAPQPDPDSSCEDCGVINEEPSCVRDVLHFLEEIRQIAGTNPAEPPETDWNAIEERARDLKERLAYVWGEGLG